MNSARAAVTTASVLRDGILLLCAAFILFGCGNDKKPAQRVSEVPVQDTMVLVPAGEFWMGAENGEKDEQPVHKVWVDSFYIDRYPVTNAQYDRFIAETGHPPPLYREDARCNDPGQPVVGVSWKDALAYCAWRSGKEGGSFSLPTEAQWEKAARSEDKRIYPWGNDPPGKKHAPTEITEKMPAIGMCELGNSPYGVSDLVGNVWNWCLDWYDREWYGGSPEKNPSGPEKASRKVVRGGNWVFLGCCSGTPAYALRASRRNAFHPGLQKKTIGFRCVKRVGTVGASADSAVSAHQGKPHAP